MNNNPQRLIPVKKADGTIERITLEEFKKRQQAGKKENQDVVKTTPQNVAVPAVVPLKIKPAPLTVTPVKKETPLLEETLENTDKAFPTVSDSHNTDVEKVMGKLHFNIVEPERLRAAILARIKDVRTAEQTIEKLMTPREQGGVGLKIAEAQGVLSACGEIMSGNRRVNIPGSGKSVVTQSVPAKPELSKNSPLDIFVEQRSLSGQADDISSLLKKQPAAPAPQALASQPMRPVVRDVVPARQSGFGPVDEIQSYTLVDFRRLSAKPVEAASRLQQKFFILRDESYLFYIKAIVAWRQSPLYLAVSGAAAEALNTGKKLSDVLSSKEIKLEEARAIMAMEKELI